MPNWCNNNFELVGPKEKIREFESFLDANNGKDWFDFFLPCPQELKDVGDVKFSAEPDERDKILIEKYGHADWYSWSVDKWGCKWNCDANDWSVSEYDEQNLSITFWFDSPWGPPTALYEFISQQEDMNVFAGYHEEGMAFVGRFENGEDESYEYSDLDSLDDIPEDIVEDWNLREMLEDRAEWDEEEEFNEIVEDFDGLSDESKEKVLDELQDEFDKMKGEDDTKVEPFPTGKKWPN